MGGIVFGCDREGSVPKRSIGWNLAQANHCVIIIDSVAAFVVHTQCFLSDAEVH